ncbi:MAG: SEC-C domain-containing protein [Cyclobacteriaceae bacterium]|nr:SEC-C domain-containing protein [Cyclobacteriaceae bacterium]
MKKVGRNDPCPCGSGKKFKKCCLDIYGEDYKQPILYSNKGKSQFSEYLKKHETGHVLDLVTALQLIPKNYGKNIRIELIAAEAVQSLSTGKPGDYTKLRSIISNEFPSHHHEDLPEDLFTENILFHGGNYIVMPGINSYAVDIFKYLTEVIYTTRNNFSKEFKDEIYQGVSLVLMTGEILFRQAHLERNVFVENLEQPLELPEKLLHLSFDRDTILGICKAGNINPSMLERFVTKPGEPNLEDPYHSPLLYKPFVAFEGEYYFVLPSCEVLALNEFILNTIKKHNVREKIHQFCHKSIWGDIWEACDKMGWALTDIPIPEKSPGQSIMEGIFQFDAYMLAYVCYTFPPTLQGNQEMLDQQNDDLLAGNSLNRRMKAVITELKARKELEGYQFLTFILINSMGGFSAMAFDKPQEYEQRIWFNVFDFITLAYAGEWDRLDLWKYAKVYESTTQKAKIMATSPLDAYATFKRNGETFYLSDESRFNFLTIVPGDGADFTRKAKINADVHGVPSLVDGSLVYQSVRRCREYAPIYKPVKQRIPYEMLLESYHFPIWVQNYQAKSKTEAGYVEHLADAICFWLDRLRPALYQQVNGNIAPVLNIVLEFDQSYFDPIPLEQVDSKETLNLSLQCSYNKGILTIALPKHIRKLFIGGDNAGERALMTEILKAFNTIPGIALSDQYISENVNKFIPLGQAKMILLLDTRTDLQLDNRWLLPSLYISDAEINLLLDRLVSIINSPHPIPEKFQSVSDKKEFCNYVVLRLVQYLFEKLKEFNSESLISTLIDINERLVHDREFSKIKIAAEIHCFGNNEKELEKILIKQKKLVNTSLATRCLIEFVVFVPAKGDRKPSFDQLDELLTIMNEILNYGMLSDTLHFEMNDPEMGLLPSGRIGISKEFFDQKLQPFYRDNTVASIEAQLEVFSSQFETYTSKKKDSHTESLLDQMDEAFLKDWGIDYTNLLGICIQAAAMAENNGDSVTSMLEADLLAELKQIMTGAEDQVEAGLEKLRFEYKPDIISDQKGYLNPDYFPWKYNREFSYARRPFVVVDTENGRKYYWGMRQCVAASQYLNQLLHSGRLINGGTKINSLLGSFNEENGKHFRNSVTKWIKDNTALVVWDYEITIKPKGHFNAEKDYGDCDILAYDPTINQVYNIECKRTEAARNIHQMKKEMDAYLGRAGQKKKVTKHVNRDNWLQANLDQVKTFVGAEKSPKVKSLIITSELIPTRYLKSGELPMPIISYHELKRNGYSSLRNCQ